jgi:lysophospholipid acyltransferase 7
LKTVSGPYFTYKTFHDYFHLPFAANAENSFKATLEKLKFVPIYIALFLLTSSIFPLEYATTDEFYTQRSWLYRLFFVWPSFFIFRMRIYSGIILAECICVSAGFGAYPKELEPKCGHGPSKAITTDLIEKPENREYNFETIENMNVSSFETCLTFREACLHWNRTVQYWLAMYVYKRFPSKKYRTIVLLAVSAYWHGVHAGYYFCILGPVFYLPIEDLYCKLLKFDEVTATQQKLINATKWILKFFAASYMGTAFLLKDVAVIWNFYGSVYHFAYVFWAILYVACVYLWKQKKAALKKSAKTDENASKVEGKQLKVN